MRIACTLCLAAMIPLSALAGVTVDLQPDRLRLANDQVVRELALIDGVWRTVSIARADGSDPLISDSDEFAITMMDGTQLGIADYVAQGRPLVDLTGLRAEVRIHYTPRGSLPDDQPQSVTVIYALTNEPYLRKTLVLAMRAQGAVDSLSVERFRTKLLTGRKPGGRGEPVFMGDDWFAGLEYPGADNLAREGQITLVHYPGLARERDADLGLWRMQSKTAVIGAGSPDDPIELAFSDYVDTIRIPTRDFMQYNSWYDWRGNELTVDNLVSTYEGFRKNLLEPYGLTMHAFVPDDGWQNGESIWGPRENLYPDGFAPLRDALEARGTRMGIWMPLNGTNLNTEWGAEQGYEKSNRGGFYCLVGPKYNAAIREATKRIIAQGNLSYYKHDFNSLRCSADGHGHLPDDRHGHEANLDAELDLLAYERKLQPEIFLNVTSNVWLSAWWLQHADSIWMCANDFGYNKDYPQLSPREWAMSYRDAHFHTVYKKDGHLVPVSAMMTHGIIHGRLCKLGGNEETLREWSDYCVMYYGRGVQLKELYVTPDLLDEDWWRVLGQATRWATDNHRVLEKVIMVGGDPRLGEPYGYAHWLDDTGILCLRNPAPFEQQITVPFDKTVKYRGATGKRFKARAVYPWVESLPAAFTSGEPVTLTLPACSVMVFELTPGSPSAGVPARPGAPIQASGRASMNDGGASTVEIDCTLPAGEMPRCDLYLIIGGTSRGVDFSAVKVDGEAVKTRRRDGDGWILHCLDLTPHAGRTVRITAYMPGGGSQPFSSPDVTVSGYVVADVPVAATPVPDESLPFAISQDFRRVSVQAVPETRLERRQAQAPVTAEQLKSIKAAKLRIRVFDANGEEQYRDKYILLNGERIGLVPANKGTLSAWQETVIDLSPEQLGLVKMRNTLQLTNAGGDCYKFTGLALAAQLADGTWVESSADWQVCSSVPNWLYTEGKLFTGEKSPEITVVFGRQ